MEKIPTLFIRNTENMKLVTNVINPDCLWMLEGGAIPTIKKDGTNIQVWIDNGRCINIFKRRNPTREEKALGAQPEYILADINDPADQYIVAAVKATDFSNWPNGSFSCEALGPKIQGGIESSVPCLYSFDLFPEVINEPIEITYDSIKEYLSKHEIEGIVWHKQTSNGTKLAKIKRRDFNFQWPVKK